MKGWGGVEDGGVEGGGIGVGAWGATFWRQASLDPTCQHVEAHRFRDTRRGERGGGGTCTLRRNGQRSRPRERHAFFSAVLEMPCGRRKV